LTTGWTPARVDTLKRLWAEGLSCAQIAAQLGDTTRNAVIGKVHRLKIVDRRQPLEGANLKLSRKPKAVRPERTSNFIRAPRQVNPDKAAMSKANSANAAGASIVRRTLKILSGPSLPPTPFPVIVFAGDIARCSLLELDNHTCRFPIGDPHAADFGFCAAPSAPGRPYCAAHAARAYNAVPTLPKHRAMA
jgi:GcrA cell cycle regulator